MADQTLSSPRLSHLWLRNLASKLPANLYIALLIVAGYGLALGGSYAIGATKYGFFVLGGLFALITGIVIMLRPEFGLYVLVVFAYTNMSDALQVSFGLPSTNKPLVAIIFLGTLANRVVLHRKPIIFRVTEMLILTYGLVIGLSLMTGQGESDVKTVMLDWFKDFAILLIIVQLCDNDLIWRRMQWALIVSAGIIASFSAFQVLTGSYSFTFFELAKAGVNQVVGELDSYRVSGPLDDPNFYGMILVMTLPIAVYRALDEPNLIRRGLAAGLSLVIAATIIFTYSRGAFLAMVVVAVLIVRERKMNIYKVGIAVGIVVLVLAPLAPKGFQERLSTLNQFIPGAEQPRQTEESLQGRSSEAIIALRMFLDYPLLGVGRGNYAYHYLDYSEQLGMDDRLEERQAHSLYLEAAAETGLIGIVAFAGMLGVLYVGFWRARRLLVIAERPDLISWVSGIQFGLTAYLLASIFLHGDYARYMWLIIGFTAASSVVAEAQYQRFIEARKRASIP